MEHFDLEPLTAQAPRSLVLVDEDVDVASFDGRSRVLTHALAEPLDRDDGADRQHARITRDRPPFPRRDSGSGQADAGSLCAAVATALTMVAAS